MRQQSTSFVFIYYQAYGLYLPSKATHWPKNVLFAPTVLRGPACLPGKAEVYQELTNCTHTYTAGHGGGTFL